MMIVLMIIVIGMVVMGNGKERENRGRIEGE